jgi:Fungal fucose-specific lectin
MSSRSLTCFGVNAQATRVYYLNGSSQVCELAWDNSNWVTTNVSVDASVANGASPSSALTCFGVSGQYTRVYYFDRNSQIWELAWDNGKWLPTNLNTVAKPTAPSAAPGSALTCFGVNGQYTRLYYLDAESQVWELAWDNGKWIATNLNTAVTPTAPAAARGSDLTCFGVNGQYTRVYYLDTQSQAWELAWENGKWAAANINTAAIPTAPSAAPGSALTCFGVNGQYTRLYYLNNLSQVCELAWDNGKWVPTNLSVDAFVPIGAAPGSALTCFGVNGLYTRIYYLDNGSQAWELAWDNGKWVATNLTAQASESVASVSPSAMPGSALACFGVGGSATRLYYATPDGTTLNEMAWQNHWVNRKLLIDIEPADPVTAPSAGLGSSSNYILYSKGASLINVSVTIDITDDIVSHNGFGFQLNAYSPSPKGDSCAWQQYSFVVTSNGLYAVINNWPVDWYVDGKYVDLILEWVPLQSLSSNNLVAGYQLTVTLQNDTHGNVTGANFKVVDNNGVMQANVSKPLLSFNYPGFTEADLAPINGFELDLVGPDGGQSTELTSGQGVIFYSATNALTALNTEPPGDLGIGTAESANSFYTQLPASYSDGKFVQMFTSSTTRAQVIKKGIHTLRKPASAL